MILEGKVMCKYYPKALCLRDDTGRCGECPYHKVYLEENSGGSKDVMHERFSRGDLFES